MDRRIYDQMRAVEDDHWWFRGRRQVIAAMLRSASGAGGLRSASGAGGLGSASGAGGLRSASGAGGLRSASARVLDAGCGSGGNLGSYTRFGDVLGVDTDDDALAHALGRGYCAVGVAALGGLPFRNATFDLVCATDVVEHVEDDVGALLELHRVTAPGGHLLVTVPAHRWLWSDSDVQLGHHRRYVARELEERCTEAGWQVCRTTYFNTVLLPPIAAMRWVRQRRGSGFAPTELAQTGPGANRVLRVPMALEARLVSAGVRLPTGVSIASLCRR